MPDLEELERGAPVLLSTRRGNPILELARRVEVIWNRLFVKNNEMIAEINSLRSRVETLEGE